MSTAGRRGSIFINLPISLNDKLGILNAFFSIKKLRTSDAAD